MRSHARTAALGHVTNGPPREPDRFLEVNELDRSEVVEAVDAGADGGAPGRVAYGRGEPRV